MKNQEHSQNMKAGNRNPNPQTEPQASKMHSKKEKQEKCGKDAHC